MQTDMGLWVSANVFRSLNEDIQNVLINALKGSVNALSTQDDDNEEGLADFSLAQAKKFLTGCSQKTQDVIREMVKSDSRFFQLRDVTDALNMDFDTESLSGVWAGITKRTRTILGDTDSYLIGWDQDENYVYSCGKFSAMTYKSLRKALNIT
jgi:hypothetical protein